MNCLGELPSELGESGDFRLAVLVPQASHQEPVANGEAGIARKDLAEGVRLRYRRKQRHAVLCENLPKSSVQLDDSFFERGSGLGVVLQLVGGGRTPKILDGGVDRKSVV